MFIYKITNTKNNKVYIGQTIRPIQERFKRHKTDALNNILDTHFARAIRYYGEDAFIIEQIDTAETQEELNQKEQYWIRYYDSVNTGYNETDAIYKCGGNTYKSKTEEEMQEIKQRIRKSKLGEKNPNATGVKCKNVNTGEEYHFGSQSEMQAFFNETNHQFISRRCLHQTQCLYKNEWLIAYEQDEYIKDYTLKGQTKKKGTQIKVTDLNTNQEYIFKSVRKAEQEMKGQLPSRNLISKILKGERPQPKNYKLETIE